MAGPRPLRLRRERMRARLSQRSTAIFWVLGGTLLDLSAVIVVATAALGALCWNLASWQPPQTIGAVSPLTGEGKAGVVGAPAVLPMLDSGQIFQIAPVPEDPGLSTPECLCPPTRPSPKRERQAR